MKKEQHIAELITLKQQGKLDASGEQELERWLEEDPALRDIIERIADRDQLLEKLKTYALFDKDGVQSRLEEELFGKKTIRLNSSILLRYAAAILLPLLVLGGMAWWLLGKTDTDLMAEIDTHIHPGHDRAVLVLSDGSSIELDPSLDMERMEEGNATIRKADRGIHYESISGGQVQKRTLYNRLITPRGGAICSALQMKAGSG